MNDKEFIGRHKELEEFKEFLAGNRPNLKGEDKGARLLLVVGDRSIGKRSLLQEMAKQAEDQGHLAFYQKVTVDGFDDDMKALLVAPGMEKRIGGGTPKQWNKFASILFDKPVKLYNLLKEIRKESDPASRVGRDIEVSLYDALKDLDSRTTDEQKIVILLYPDPQRGTPDKLLSLLAYMHRFAPKKVRFVVAQTPTDVLIREVEAEEGSIHQEELKIMSAKKMEIGPMSKEDSLKLIEVYDEKHQLNEEMRRVYFERYGGWPKLLTMGLEELQKIEDEITEEIIKALPDTIANFWDKRYINIKDLDSRNFVQTVNLLPHPYRESDVGQFATLTPASVELISDDESVRGLLKKEEYTNRFAKKPEYWGKCPFYQHPTTRDYVVNRLKKGTDGKDLYTHRLNNIVAHYRNKTKGGYEKTKDRDALVYLFPYIVEAKSWKDVKDILTNVIYLKRMQTPEEQYHFQNDFINLMKNKDISDKELKDILTKVLEVIKTQLPIMNKGTDMLIALREKADWLDTFAYWINEFRVKDGSKRSKALKEIANQFDKACGDVSKDLAKAYLKEGKKDSVDWALRFAELNTWVNERSENYNECINACRQAEEMCLQKGMKRGYQYLGRSEFIRLRSHALTLAGKEADKSKKNEYEKEIRKAYEELNEVFHSQGAENRWPTIKEWEELEQYLVNDTDNLLTPPSQAESGQPIAFKAKVVSNQADSVSAIHIIRFFESNGGQVEWIHHKNFKLEQFIPEDTLFTVLIGGPKSPGISKVAFEFIEDNRKDFLDMYSGLTIGAKRLRLEKCDNYGYMLGGISKVNTLMAAYEFTMDSDVKQIIEATALG